MSNTLTLDGDSQTQADRLLEEALREEDSRDDEGTGVHGSQPGGPRKPSGNSNLTVPALKPWMQCVGQLCDLHEENERMMALIDAEFEQVEPEDCD